MKPTFRVNISSPKTDQIAVIKEKYNQTKKNKGNQLISQPTWLTLFIKKGLMENQSICSKFGKLSRSYLIEKCQSVILKSTTNLSIHSSKLRSCIRNLNSRRL